MNELYLLRHGATEWNRLGRYAGHTDLPLDIKELHRLSGAKDRLKGISFSNVYCSDMRRTGETLGEVRPDLSGSVILDARLRELHFGLWEGKTYDVLKTDRVYTQWLADPRRQSPPGGEAMSALEDRVRSFIQEELRSNAESSDDRGPVLIISHGGPIRVLITQLLTGRSFWDIDLPCGCLYLLRMDLNSLIRLDSRSTAT
ncbi:histidine phosphatase family protein [Paenibacillus tarimensis]